MKKYPYFPGCTLTNKAKGLNELAKKCGRLLGLELAELEKWYCCQANFSPFSDNLMNHLAPVRTLVSASEEGSKLVTLCSTCYYVLKRVNLLMAKDPEKRKVVLEFLEKEAMGKIEVVHFLEFLRDEIGFAKLKEKVKQKLAELKVAPYYGCQLLRPAKELAFDDPYEPVIYENFLKALDCRVVDHAFKAECCGSFLTTFSAQGVEDCVLRIISAARKNGAEAITTSCPLCNFNLEWGQQKIREKNKKFQPLPVIYLTELLALAMGVEISPEIWAEHVIDPRPYLEKKGCLKPQAVAAQKK